VPLSFRRRIFESDILLVDESSGDEATSYYCFHLRGSSFLWHQVRCMMAILFLVGQEREDISVVSTMMDEEGNKGRPMYEMAPETPLVLAECGYDEGWYVL
jgi:tRNA pseudouridine38/39 synthase